MTYREWKDHADTYWRTHPTQRYGQALFNALHEVRPDLANFVRSGTLDPFYQDSKSFVFLDWVEAHW